MECKSKISGTRLRHAGTYHIKGRSEGFIGTNPGPSYHNVTTLRMTFQCGARCSSVVRSSPVIVVVTRGLRSYYYCAVNPGPLVMKVHGMYLCTLSSEHSLAK